MSGWIIYKQQNFFFLLSCKICEPGLRNILLTTLMHKHACDCKSSKTGSQNSF